MKKITPPFTVGIKDLGYSLLGGGGAGQKRKKKSLQSDEGGSASTQAAAVTPVLSDEDIIKGYLGSLYSAYQSQPLSYAAQSSDDLMEGIAGWLRPTVDQAIRDRKTLTGQYHAELDADAIARGMGASSYVTDVKSRQNDSEAGDITRLEGEYAAALSKHLSQALENQRDRELEVQMLNVQNDQAAYLKAYEAALDMFKAYKGGSGVVNTKLSYQGESSRADWDQYLSTLSPEGRKALYQGDTADNLLLRSQLISDVGALDYLALQQQYPPA